MSKKYKPARPEAHLPKGFRDVAGAEIRAQNAMLAKLREVFERYGYDPLETSAIEYTDALGKFLPDQDRPNAGVFSFADEDGQWMSLRYDMTAPLARYVAENFASLPKPYRRYAMGPVWRNEKPGPGRFRQFMQCDADTVGTDNVAADAEACMLMADAIEALGIERGEYVVKVNNRKVLDGIMEVAGLAGVENESRRVTVLRAIDKFDRLGLSGVRSLLGSGRKDESGDFTKGAELTPDQIDVFCQFLAGDARAFFNPGAKFSPPTDDPLLADKKGGVMFPSPFADPGKTQQLFSNPVFSAGIQELNAIRTLVEEANFGPDRIRIDQTVVRGLDYYTGPVFEAELTFEVKNEDGQPVRFGSVGGGGRYDDLVARFTGERVPATGFSIGVSRLQAALAQLDTAKAAAQGPVVVLVMDKAQLPRYQALAQRLRAAGIRAEMYLGTSGMKPQMKYADRRGAPCVVIQGGDEIALAQVQIKDLIEGAKAAAAIKDNAAWKAARPAQVSVPEGQLVEAVREILARHGL